MGTPSLIHHAGSGFDFRDTPTEYEKTTMAWCEAAYEEALYDNSQSDEVKDFSRQVDYLMGKQWPAGRPSYKSRPVNNRVWRIFWELVSVLTDISPIARIATSNPDQYRDQARVLDILARSWWTDSNADLKLAQLIVYALLSTAYAKIEWNPYLPGGPDFEMLVLGPNDVLPLKPRDSIASSQAVIYQSVQPLNYFRKRYPTKGWAVQADPRYSTFKLPDRVPPNVSPMTFQHLAPQMQRLFRNSAPQQMPSAFPMALYREFWFQDETRNESATAIIMGDKSSNWWYVVGPGDKLYPRGRLICTGGRVLLYDGPNPYWHGQFPFAALRMNVVPWQWHGISEIKSWLPLQDIINNIYAGVMDMIKKAVNPVVIGPKNAMSDAAWKTADLSMPGAKMAYSQMAGTAPSVVPTPQIPAFVTQFLTLSTREMDQASGLAAITEATRKNQVPSGDTLDAINQAKQTPLRLKSRYIEVFLRDIGSLSIPNFLQFYDLKRRIMIAGQKGMVTADLDADKATMVPHGTNAPEHSKNFFFTLQHGSLLNLDADKKAMLMMNLKKMGAVDLQTLWEQLQKLGNLDIDIDQVVERVRKENKDQAAMQAQAGPRRR